MDFVFGMNCSVELDLTSVYPELKNDPVFLTNPLSTSDRFSQFSFDTYSGNGTSGLHPDYLPRYGCTDRATGLSIRVPLYAPRAMEHGSQSNHSLIISPLSTLKVALLSINGVSEADADREIRNAFGISSNMDPDIDRSAIWNKTLSRWLNPDHTQLSPIAVANSILFTVFTAGSNALQGVLSSQGEFNKDSSRSVHAVLAQHVMKGTTTRQHWADERWLSNRFLEAVGEINKTIVNDTATKGRVKCVSTLVAEATKYAISLPSTSMASTTMTTQELQLLKLFKLSEHVQKVVGSDVYKLMSGVYLAYAECFAGRSSVKDSVDSLGKLPVYGCTDSVAVGFSKVATHDDGSCNYDRVLFRHVKEGEIFSLNFAVYDKESSASSIKFLYKVQPGDSQKLYPCVPDGDPRCSSDPTKGCCPSVQEIGRSDQRRVEFKPESGQYGHAVMEIGIFDGLIKTPFQIGAEKYEWMVVDVQNIPDKPFFRSTDAQTVYIGSQKTIFVRVEDTDTPIEQVVIWATSGNVTILHNRDITVDGMGYVRKITLRIPKWRDGKQQIEGDTVLNVAADDGRAFLKSAEKEQYGVLEFPLKVRKAPAIDPTQCWATGTGLEYAVAGKPATFTVYTVDVDGDIQGAGAAVTIEQHGPTYKKNGKDAVAKIKFIATSLDDGIIRYKYTPTMRGKYLIIIKQGGSKIRHGAFDLYVNHTKMSQANSVFTSTTQTAAGAGLNVTIQTRDKFSNIMSGHSDVWQLRLWNGFELQKYTMDAMEACPPNLKWGQMCAYEGMYQQAFRNCTAKNSKKISCMQPAAGAGHLENNVCPNHPADCLLVRNETGNAYMRGNCSYGGDSTSKLLCEATNHTWTESTCAILGAAVTKAECDAYPKSQWNGTACKTLGRTREECVFQKNANCSLTSSAVCQSQLSADLDGSSCRAKLCKYQHGPELAGNYVAYVSSGGQSLGSGPLKIRIWPDVTDPDSCITTGAGTSFGIQEEMLSFEVITRDKYQNRRIRGGDKFSMVFSGAGQVLDKNKGRSKFYEDNMDGSYTVTYNCPDSGLYSVGMRLGKIHIKGSPFEVFIDIAQNTDPASIIETYAYDDGVVDTGNKVAGVEQQFKIQAVDDRKEKKGLGGDKFRVMVVGTEFGSTKKTNITFPCTDYNIGIYYCKYAWNKTETITINVELKGIENTKLFQHIRGGPKHPSSPFQVAIIPSGISARNCIATGTALGVSNPSRQQKLFAGTTGRVEISTADKYGNDVIPNPTQLAGFVAIVVNAKDISKSFQGKVMKGKGNQIIVTYNIKKAGDYNVDLTSVGEDLVCVATGLAAMPECQNKSKILPPKTTCGRQHSKCCCPSKLTVYPDALDPAQSSVEGSGRLIGGTTSGTKSSEAGVNTSVIAYSRDTYGNLRTAGGDTFLASLQVVGQNTPLTVVDWQNGSYLIQYSTEKSGQAILTVKVEVNRTWVCTDKQYSDQSSCVAAGMTWSKQPCTASTCVNVGPVGPGRSPYTVAVSFGPPAASKVIAAGSGLSSCVAGTVRDITLESFDAYGNKVTKGGAAVVVTVIMGANTNASVSVPVTVADQSNGRYTVQYTPTQKGVYSVVATINGFEIPAVTLSTPSNPNSPRRAITVAYAETQKCKVTPAVLPTATAGIPNSFTVQSMDRFGNTRVEDSDQIHMSRADGGAIKFAYTHEGKGLYRVTWTVSTGINALKTKWLNVKAGPKSAALKDLIPVQGSAFSLNVLPGQVSPNSVTLGIGDQGLYTAQAGAKATFSITAQDAFGNLLEGNVPGLKVIMVGRNGEGTLIGKVGQNDDNTGLQASYTAQKVGVYDRSVTVNGVPITQLKTLTTPLVIRPGEIVPSRCTASGGGLTNAKMGTDAKFTITVRDQFDNFIRDSIRSKNYACGVAKKDCGTPKGSGEIDNLITEPLVTTGAIRSTDATITITMYGCGVDQPDYVAPKTKRDPITKEVLEGRASVCPKRNCDLGNPVVQFKQLNLADNTSWGTYVNPNLFAEFKLVWVVGESDYVVQYKLVDPGQGVMPGFNASYQLRYACEDASKTEKSCPQSVLTKGIAAMPQGGCPVDPLTGAKWKCSKSNEQYYRLDIALERWTKDVTQFHQGSKLIGRELISKGRRCFYGGTIKGRTPYMYGSDIAHADMLGKGGKEAGSLSLFIQDVNMEHARIGGIDVRVPRTEETDCGDMQTGVDTYSGNGDTTTTPSNCVVKRPCLTTGMAPPAGGAPLSASMPCWFDWTFQVQLVGQASTDPLTIHDTALGLTVDGKAQRCEEKYKGNATALKKYCLQTTCRDTYRGANCKTQFGQVTACPLNNADKLRVMKCNLEYSATTMAVYQVDFTVKVAGVYNIFAVSSTGASVDGSGFVQITVRAAQLSAEHSEVSGTGRTSATAGIVSKLSILGRDRFGNARVAGGSEFEITATSAAILPSGVSTFLKGAVPKGSCSVKKICTKGNTVTNDDKTTCDKNGGTFSSKAFATKIQCLAAKEKWTNGFAWIYEGSYTIGKLDTYDAANRKYGEFMIHIKTKQTCLDSNGVKDSSKTSKTDCENAGKAWMEAGRAVGAAGQRSPFKVYATPGTPDAEHTVLPGVTPTDSRSPFKQNLKAGDPATVAIELADVYGNPRITGGDNVTMSACSSAGCVPSTTPAAGDKNRFTTTDNADGTYTVRYKFEKAVPFTVGIVMNGNSAKWKDSTKALTNTGTVPIQPAPAQGGTSFTLFVPPPPGTPAHQMQAGKKSKFTIYAADQFGNAVLSGAYKYTVIIKTINAETGVVKICTDCATIAKASTTGRRLQVAGQVAYDVTYSSNVAGNLTMEVLLGSTHILGSPFTKTVEPSAISVAKTTAAGPGIQYMIANQLMQFNIEARDTFGNLKADRSLVFDVAVQPSAGGSSGIAPIVTYDAKTGKYKVEYTATQTGNFDILITTTVNGKKIGIFGNPFRNIICDTTTVASWVQATGPGLKSAVNGEMQWFNIRAFGDGPAKLVGGDKFVVELEDATLLGKAVVKDSNNGRYVVEYRAWQGPSCKKAGKEIASSLRSTKANCESAGGTWAPNSGQFKVKVFLEDSKKNRIQIGGKGGAATSPFSASLTAGKLSTQSRANGRGLATATAGAKASFDVTALDWWLNPKPDMVTKDIFVASVVPMSYASRVNSSSAVASMKFMLDANGKGVYSGGYTTPIAGYYILSIKSPTAYNGISSSVTELANSPWNISVIPASSDAISAISTGPGLKSAVAGIQAYFNIQAVDAYGNFARDDRTDPKTGFIGQLGTGSSVTITSSAPSVIKYPFPGTYVGKWTETLVGTTTLSIMLGTTLVKGAPFQVIVSPGKASAAHCDAYGPGTQKPAAEDTALFYIQARDKYLNHRSGSADDFEFRMRIASAEASEKDVCLDGVTTDECKNNKGFRGPKRAYACNGHPDAVCTMDRGQYVGNYTVTQGVLHKLFVVMVHNLSRASCTSPKMEWSNSKCTQPIGTAKPSDTDKTKVCTSKSCAFEGTGASAKRHVADPALAPSPYEVDVRAASNFPPNCYAFGSGLGSAVPVQQNARQDSITDKHNAHTACALSFQDSAQKDYLPGTRQDNLVQSLQLYTWLRSRGQVKTFEYKNCLDPGRKFKPSKHAKQCTDTCWTDGGIAGEVHTFTIQSVSKAGAIIVKASDQYEIEAQGPQSYRAVTTILSSCDGNSDPGNNFPCGVATSATEKIGKGLCPKAINVSNPCINGTYAATYNATVAGQYQLNIQSLGRPIGTSLPSGGSPYTVTIVPTEYNAEKSVAIGASAMDEKHASPGVSVMGEKRSFTIIGKDKYGNIQLTGINDHIIKTSKTFRVYAVSKRAEVASTAIDKMVHWIDTSPKAHRCGSSWPRTSTCPQPTMAHVTDNKNGTYLVEYSSPIGGEYQLYIEFDGVQITGSPATRFTLSSANFTTPLVGPVSGGTTIQLEHDVWQPYTAAEIASSKRTQEFACGFDLPNSTKSVETPATWVDVNKVQCDTPLTNFSGKAQVSLLIRGSKALLGKTARTGTTRFIYYDIPTIHTILPEMGRVLMRARVIGSMASKAEFNEKMAVLLGVPVDPSSQATPPARLPAIEFISKDDGDGTSPVIRFFAKEIPGVPPLCSPSGTPCIKPPYMPDQDKLKTTLEALIARRATVAGMLLDPTPMVPPLELMVNTSIYYGPSTGGSELIFKGNSVADACIADHHMIGRAGIQSDVFQTGTHKGQTIQNLGKYKVNAHGCHFCCRFGNSTPVDARFDPNDGQLKCRSKPRCLGADTQTRSGDSCPGASREIKVQFSFNCQNFHDGHVVLSYFDVVEVFTPASVSWDSAKPAQPIGPEAWPTWGKIIPAGPTTGDTNTIVRLVGINLFDTEHLETHCDFDGRPTTPRVDVYVLDETTLLCKSPIMNPIQHITVPVELTVDRLSITKNRKRFRYYMPPQLPDNSLEPPIGPSFGGTAILIKGVNMDLGTNYTCRFGDEITGQVIQAETWPNCTRGTQAYGDLGDARAIESGPGKFDSAQHCVGHMMCRAVTGNVGTSKVVTISLNGQQYTSTQQLFTYYGQTGIPYPKLDDGKTDGIRPDRAPRNSSQEIEISYLYACGFQVDFKAWMRCKFTKKNGRGAKSSRGMMGHSINLWSTTRTVDKTAIVGSGAYAPLDRSGKPCCKERVGEKSRDKYGVRLCESTYSEVRPECEDVVQGGYVSDIVMKCDNPKRGWVHDADLSIALNSVDYTDVRPFVYYGAAIAVLPYFDADADAEYLQVGDTHLRSIIRDSDELVYIRGLKIEAEDENQNWVPQDIAVVGYNLTYFVTAPINDRFQAFAPLQSQRCVKRTRLGAAFCPDTSGTCSSGMYKTRGACISTKNVWSEKACMRTECLSGTVRINCYENETYTKRFRTNYEQTSRVMRTESLTNNTWDLNAQTCAPPIDYSDSPHYEYPWNFTGGLQKIPSRPWYVVKDRTAAHLVDVSSVDFQAAKFDSKTNGWYMKIDPNDPSLVTNETIYYNHIYNVTAERNMLGCFDASITRLDRGAGVVEYMPDYTLHPKCDTPVEEGRVVYPYDKSRGVGNLSIPLPLAGDFTLNFVVDSKGVVDLAPAELNMRVYPGLTDVGESKVVQDDPQWRRVVGKSLDLTLETRDVAGNLRMGAGSRAGGDSYEVTIRKLDCVNGKFKDDLKNNPKLTAADKRKLPNVDPQQIDPIFCAAISPQNGTHDLTTAFEAKKFSSTDLGTGSYEIKVFIPVSEDALGLYSVSIKMTSVVPELPLPNSPFTLVVEPIDCCSEFRNRPDIRPDEIDYFCGMVSNQAGDDCLCKAGWFTDQSKVEPCRRCSEDHWKSTSANESCTSCPPDTNTFKRVGVAAEFCQDENGKDNCCVCAKEFYNVTTFRKVGCFPEHFEEGLALKPTPDEMRTNCKKCPECVKCPGDNMFFIEQNYWAKPDNKYMYRCPNYEAFEQCWGNERAYEEFMLKYEDDPIDEEIPLFECRDGFTGIMCSECAAEWIRTDEGCSDCNTPQMSSGHMLFQCLTFFCFVICVVCIMRFVRPSDMCKIKILIDFGQLLSSFAPTFEINWPRPAMPYLDFFKYFNFDLTMMMKTWGCSNPFFATFYVKFAFVTLIPVTLCMIIYVHWRIGQRGIEKNRQRAAVKPTQLECVVEDIDWKGNCVSRCFFILTLLYLKTSNTVLDAFKCRKMAGDERYLEVDYAANCDDPLHYSFQAFAIIMVFIYPFGIPGMALALMKQKVEGKESYYEVQKTFGFLYADYHDNCWYWGVLNLVRKLSLSGMLIFFKRGSVTQLMLAMIIACVFLVGFTRKFPFEDTMNNSLEFFAELCTFFTLFGAMMNKVRFASATTTNSTPDMLGSILVLINLGVPLLGVSLTMGGYAYEYRKYYQAKLSMLQGIGSLGTGLLMGAGAGLMGKTFALFGVHGVDVSTSQALLESARKHAAKCARSRKKATGRFKAAERRVQICDEWLHLVEQNAADEQDAERLFSHIEKSVMHTDNKTGVGKILSVEQWWEEILENRHGDEGDDSMGGRFSKFSKKLASVGDEERNDRHDHKKHNQDYEEEFSSSSEDSGEEMDMEGGIVRPREGVEQIADVLPEDPLGAYVYVGTQGALAEADEAEHFVPTKMPTPFDWERMAEFLKSRKQEATERHMLDIKPDVMAPRRITPFHLRDVVQADGAAEVEGLQKRRKKKKKKKLPAAWNVTPDYEAAKAKELAEFANPMADEAAPPAAREPEPAAREPEPAPAPAPTRPEAEETPAQHGGHDAIVPALPKARGESGSGDAIVPALPPPRRKKKKKAVAT
jgi:hypothetical protein